MKGTRRKKRKIDNADEQEYKNETSEDIAKIQEEESREIEDN